MQTWEAYKLETDHKEIIIGQGTYGNVSKIWDKPRQIYLAQKTLARPSEYIPSLNKEIEILADCQHSNVVRLYHEKIDTACLTFKMEFCNGGSLTTFIRNLNTAEESQALKVCSQILQGVSFLTHKNVVHRDLKPDNVLVQDVGPAGKIVFKIADFGLATRLPPRERRTTWTCDWAGTCCYMAPEQVEGNISSTSDAWACGCILFELYTKCKLVDFVKWWHVSAVDQDNHILFVPHNFFTALSKSIGVNFECTKNALHLFENLLISDPTLRWEADDALSYLDSHLTARDIGSYIRLTADTSDWHSTVLKGEANETLKLEWIGMINTNRNEDYVKCARPDGSEGYIWIDEISFTREFDECPRRQDGCAPLFLCHNNIDTALAKMQVSHIPKNQDEKNASLPMAIPQDIADVSPSILSMCSGHVSFIYMNKRAHMRARNKQETEMPTHFLPKLYWELCEWCEEMQTSFLRARSCFFGFSYVARTCVFVAPEEVKGSIDADDNNRIYEIDRHSSSGYHCAKVSSFFFFAPTKCTMYHQPTVLPEWYNNKLWEFRWFRAPIARHVSQTIRCR